MTDEYTSTTVLTNGPCEGRAIGQVALAALFTYARAGDERMVRYINALTKQQRVAASSISHKPKAKPVVEDGCYKAVYPNAKLAKDACTGDRRHLKPYLCPNCGLFHLTSK